MKLLSLKYIGLLVLISNLSFAQNKIDSLENMLSGSEKEKNLNALFTLANEYKHIGEYNKAYQYFQQTVDICEADSNKTIKAEALIKLARLGYFTGKLTSALIYSFDALDILANTDQYQNLFDAYTTLGDIYSLLGDYEKSYYFYKKAYDLSFYLSDSEIILSVNKFAKYYIDITVIDSAKKYTLKAEEYHIHDSNIPFNEYTLHNRALIYKYNNEFKKALYYIDQSINSCNLNKNFYLLSENYLVSGDIHLTRNNIKLAKQSLDKCAEVINRYSLYNKYKLYFLLAEFYEKKDATKLTLKYYRQFIHLKDSIINSPKTKNVATLKNTIERNKQKDYIKILEEKRIAQTKAVNNQKYLRVVLIISLSIVVVFLIIHIRLYKKRQAANIILKKQNEEITKKNCEIELNAEHLEKINKELEKLTLATNQTDNAILIANPKGEVEWINEGYTRLYGYTWEEFKQEKGTSYIETSSYANIKEVFTRVLSEKNSQMYEAEFAAKDGKVYHIHTTLTPILNKQNEVVRIIAIDSDITKLKKVEKELKQFLITKDKFFSIIAHDLKNPFNSLMGLAQLLVHGYDRLTPEKVKYFHSNLYQISKNGYELLINLLEWSRSQMGTMEFNPDKVSLAALVEETFSLFSGKASQKEINLTNSVDKNSVVIADQNMLKTILRNLVSNALKFTERGGAIEVSENDIDEFKEVTVRDTGVGIEPEILKKLFKLDESYTSEGTEDETGTGLGLILCKEFIEKHGGKIRVESKVGFGSKFIFTIPVQK